MNTSSSFRLLLPTMLTLLVTASCITNNLEDASETIQEVRGQVLEVTPRNVSQFETLKIQAQDGQIYQFKSDTFTGFTPAHIKEHQLFGQTLLVRFISRDGVLVAITLED
ncbi:MAG: hypothetical protein CL886_00790 [Dehalococcoidia bacterium]|nr:hypothetical protein [Dehalococcoidia bacterium]